MSDDILKRLRDLAFHYYLGRSVIEEAADRIEALTAERDEFKRLALITDTVARECKIHEARAEAAEADNARLASELTKAAARLEWCAGIIHSDKGRDQGFAWAEEARAALTGKADT